jgi:50S ribosomal subunit-associated GTPase HflX
MNGFKHGLASLGNRRTNGALTADEQDIRASILVGLIDDKGGEKQISTAMRILAEVIASDAAWLVAFNKATDDVMEKNQKARRNPKALATLDGYKRTLVNSLTGNLQRFGFEKVAKAETLEDIIDEMSEDDGPTENSSPARPGAAQNEDANG